MKYCLGLDLGVGSIGSAIIELDENGAAKSIKDAGVRIFEVSEGAEDRRTKRTMRKNLIRTRKRLELLAKKLFENNLWVNETPEGTDNLKSKNPYKIRFEAIHKKLENQNYVGRALLHLAKHRGAGYVSAAEEVAEMNKNKEENAKKKASPYDVIVEKLKSSNSATIGEYFYKRLQDENTKIIRQHDYALKGGLVDFAIPRYLVKDEFFKIWDMQAQYFPQMQKEGLKQEIYDILFYERPAAPYAIGKCIYFKDEDRLSKAHPLFQMRRIYEEVNNIRVREDIGSRCLTLEERDKIINELLMKGKSAGRKNIKELLELPKAQFSIGDDDKPIDPYLYSEEKFQSIDYIKNLSFEKLSEFAEFLSNPVDPDDAQGRLYSEDKLVKKLESILQIDDENKIGELLAKLPKSRGNLGLTATKMLLEKLKEKVISHREATDELAKTDKRFVAEEEQLRKMQGKIFELPYYGEILQSDTVELPPFVKKNNETLNADEIKWGKVANPAVHMILNQLRLVVNEIIKLYGRPYCINLELGRDVGLSTKKKQQQEKEQKDNKTKNDNAKKELESKKIPVNRDNILKYKLAEEQGWIDPYSLQQISQKDFTGLEIEHIIPRAKGGSDSFSNLCLVSRSENEAKGDMFAYEYFQSSKSPEQIQHILANARKRLPKSKLWRFEPDAMEKFNDNGDEDETNRYLQDTRYVSKLAAKYLRLIVDCKDEKEAKENRILAVKGAQTAQLRTVWNLQGLEYDLMGLNRDIPRYVPCSPYWFETTHGDVIYGENKPDIDGNWQYRNREKNPQWLSKPRIDHRHHAMDAIVVACCTRSLIQKMAHEEKMKHMAYPMPLLQTQSTGEFRRNVIAILKKIRVSHKPDHNANGQLHKETGRIVVCQDNDEFLTTYKRSILQVVKAKKDDVDKMKSLEESLNKIAISDSLLKKWQRKIKDTKKLETFLEDKEKQCNFVKNFIEYMKVAEQVLIAESEKGVQEGKKQIEITAGMIAKKTLSILNEKGLWKGNKFKFYESSKALILIEKHGIAYESGNNHCVDFYTKDGKIGWEIIKRFDANQKDFVPGWKKNGAKIIWSIQQGDLLELDTPDEWKSYTDEARCIARVKKFSEGKIAIDYMTDARMTSPQNKELKYMKVNTIDDKGLRYITDHHARKIELTPFGRIKKKHKVLTDGKKAAA